MGFSAGGHLAASASTLYVDDATRPDFSILYYPVITFDKEEYVEHGSRANLIGSEEYWAARRGMTADEYIRKIFLKLLEISRSLDDAKIEQLTAERDYEELNYYILNAILKG